MKDLKELWKGVSTYDAYEGKDFKLHAAIIWGIHDYPALGTMSGRSKGVTLLVCIVMRIHALSV
jgi:hypothetical protein